MTIFDITDDQVLQTFYKSLCGSYTFTEALLWQMPWSRELRHGTQGVVLAYVDLGPDFVACRLVDSHDDSRRVFHLCLAKG